MHDMISCMFHCFMPIPLPAGTEDYACTPLNNDMLRLIKMRSYNDMPQFFPSLFKQACDMFLERDLHMSYNDICYTNALDVYRFLLSKVM